LFNESASRLRVSEYQKLIEITASRIERRIAFIGHQL
jgi:hypothetical protein